LKWLGILVGTGWNWFQPVGDLVIVPEVFEEGGCVAAGLCNECSWDQDLVLGR